MRRILLLLFIVFVGWNSYSQPITVNTTTYTVPQLVEDVLFAPSSGSAACVGTISNITWSTGTNFGSTNGIGYFTNTNPNFPISSGVILSTGSIFSTAIPPNLPNGAPGPNSTTQSNGVNAWPGDTDLTDYMAGLGIIDPTPFPGAEDEYFNATILEFDFIPLTNQMSFEFLFASEEYGDFQCSYSDAFAFFLTNQTAGTPATNLALVPNTTIPISVTTIHDGQYFTGFGANCGNANETYFGNSNTGGAVASAATNFNGETIKMRATSAVIPNNVYHIKLVISDLNDSLYDSAVFLGGGSFDIGTVEIAGTGTEFDGITDFTGNRAVCGSKIIVAQAGLAAITGATYAWTLNGNPIGTNSFTYSITQAGTYGITITYPGGCQQTDTMVVEYLINSITLGTPNDLTQCSAPFNLSDNTPIIQNGLTNPVSYYTSLSDAQQQSFAIPNAINYNGTDGEIIYASVEDFATGCIVTTQFALQIDPTLCNTNPIPTTPPNLSLCENASGVGEAIFNLLPQIPIILGSYNPADYTVSFHLTQADADGGGFGINPSVVFGTNGQTLYVRLEENADPTFFGTTTFQLIVNPLPTATISGTTAVCQNSPSPAITFTGLNGTAPYTFTYLNPSGTSQTISTTVGNTATIPVSTSTDGVFTYTLVRVQSSGTPACSQLQSGTATVTVNQLPTATISGTTSVCRNDPSPNITFTGANGVAPYTFTYSTDGGVTTITSPPSTGNIFILPVATGTAGTFTYTLISVQSSGTPACSQLQSGSATVTVTSLPIATISGTATICSNTSTTITFNGTPTAVVDYTVDGTPAQITLDGSGVGTVITPNLTINSVYSLVSVNLTTCGQNVSGTATVTVRALPTATISGTTSVCRNATSPTITFTGLNGTAPYTFTYLNPSGTSQAISTTVGNTVTIPVSTSTDGVFTYTLVSVQSSGTTACSQLQSGTATVTVNQLPTATISGTTSVCRNDPSPNITFTGANGVAPYTFTYSTDGGVTTITSPPSTGNIFILPVATGTAGTFTYTLISVQSSGALACSQAQSGSATVAVIALPTATISGTTSVCQNTPNPSITFTGSNGTAPYTFTYLDENAASQTISTVSGNSVTIPVSTNSAGAFTYQLVSVVSSGTTVCSQLQSGSATVTVVPLPTASISGTTALCQNAANPLITFTGANGVAPYTFTYLDPSGTSQTISTTVGNSVTLSVSTGAVGIFNYQLVSVTGSGATICSQPQVGSVTVTINPSPTATISGTTAVCMGASLPFITFTGANGTAPYTFNYTLNTVPFSITTTSGDSVSLAIPSTATATTYTYSLVSVTESSATTCSQNQAGSATVTVIGAPIINTPTNYVVCDDSLNNDGFYCAFDLTTKDS
ncbi:choice-of-anchor L domain-containing protein, partial [Flavobacterium sp.]|uniref:choice-of-anchor L domain-containing protein n=1 Tax=Flavobacterium sp. TaxID=239 RepID=UPI0037BE3271